MDEIGKYIYGIINSNTEFRFFLPRELLEEENQANAIYTISYQDISAIVSDSEIMDYAYMFRDTLARFLVKHQRVIERIMSLDHTIIPMKLGTFAEGKEEIREILKKGYSTIKEIFNKISNKIELDVAVTWSDFNLALKEASVEPEIKEFKEKLKSSTKGITIDEQIKVGVMVKNILDKKREIFSQKIHEPLKAISYDSKPHELMDDKMILNTAYLIERFKHKDFEGIIENLNSEFNEKLNFRCVGPLPPYSFYTLEVKKLEFKEIDWARKKLGLIDDTVTKEDIKKTHQTMAFALHPDKNPNSPGIEKEFDEVTKAYKTLWEYCQGGECSFDEAEFKKNSILITVREDISYGAKRT